MLPRHLISVLVVATLAVAGCGGAGGSSGSSSRSSNTSQSNNTSLSESTSSSSESSTESSSSSSSSSVSDLPPVSVLSVIPKVISGRNVTAYGGNSYDPEGATVSYTWVLNKPSGSSAALSSTNAQNTSFTADIDGTYTLTLDVSDGENSASTSQSVVATAVDADPKFFIFSQTGVTQTNVPFTVGQVFPQGFVQTTQGLTATPDDGISNASLQMDVKTTWPDGSVKHAVVSGNIASLAAGAAPTYDLTPSSKNSAPAVSLTTLLNSGFDATVELDVGGTLYTASAADFLSTKPVTTWLEGPIASEWVVLGAVKNGGTEHPHLAVQFRVRAFQNGNVRVGFVVENNWMYQPNPSNQTYNATLKINGNTKYSINNLTHFHHARWNYVAWNNGAPDIHLAINPSQFIAAKVLPNYDPSLIFSTKESQLQYYDSTWVSTPITVSASDNSTSFSLDQFGPMGQGLANVYMPTTGARSDIGPLPRWGAMYLLSQDPRAKKAAFGMGDLAGSWPIHYRDKNTNQVVSVEEYPYASSVYNETNPSTGLSEFASPCSSNCATPYSPDNAHQPSLAYLPYLVSGDYFYLEELLFWSNWSVLNRGPEYREYDKGIVYGQVRARGWIMRKLGQSAEILPNGHPMKAYFERLVDNNLDYYIEEYITNTKNNYGALFPSYDNPADSPWMDDYFTWAMNHVWELGFSKAKTLLDWKARFPVKRMGFTNVADDSYCWIFGAPYRLKVADDYSSPMYLEIEQVYTATDGQSVPTAGVVFNSQGAPCGSAEMASNLGLQQGEMIGYSDQPDGFPSSMQIALAAAVDSGITGADQAWARFESRSVKPDYSGYPNYAIIPR